MTGVWQQQGFRAPRSSLSVLLISRGSHLHDVGDVGEMDSLTATLKIMTHRWHAKYENVWNTASDLVLAHAYCVRQCSAIVTPLGKIGCNMNYIYFILSASELRN